MTFYNTDNDKRRTSRSAAGLQVELVLYDSRKESILAGPSAAFIRDISQDGAGVILPKIRVSNHHLYYEPNETSSLLYLEKSWEDDSQTLSIQVLPKWYRLADQGESQIFYLGTEFVGTKSADDISQLIKMTQASVAPQKSWLESIFSK